jgi:hypothetical protein
VLGDKPNPAPPEWGLSAGIAAGRVAGAPAAGALAVGVKVAAVASAANAARPETDASVNKATAINGRDRLENRSAVVVEDKLEDEEEAKGSVRNVFILASLGTMVCLS